MPAAESFKSFVFQYVRVRAELFRRLEQGPVAHHTVSSREFNQDVGSAKRLASEGPVFVTVRGRPAHVLLTIEEYQRLTGASQVLVDLLAMPGVEDIEFEPPKAFGFSRPTDFS